MGKSVSDKCRGFLNHWLSLRTAGSHSVDYADFLDSPHPLYAPFIYITECDQGAIIIRLMGTGLVELWGRERTGDVMAKDQPESVRHALYKNTITANRRPCGIHTVLKMQTTSNNDVLVESITLPLATGPQKPIRSVLYADYHTAFGRNEVNHRYLEAPEVEWIDLGAGVPDHRPASF